MEHLSAVHLFFQEWKNLTVIRVTLIMLNSYGVWRVKNPGQKMILKIVGKLRGARTKNLIHVLLVMFLFR